MTWMTELYRNKSKDIRDIIFPGTHNSGAYNVIWTQITQEINKFPKKTGPVMRAIIKPWILCQSMNVYEQLKLGTRAFDLRLVYHSSYGWLIHHSYTCCKLSDVVNDIVKFLNETKNTLESLILIFNLANYHDSLNRELNVLNNFVWRRNVHDLEKMSELNERIIIIWNTNYPCPLRNFINNHNHVNSWSWIDDVEPKLNYLNNELNNYNNTKNDGNWKNLTFTLTPQTDSIIEYSLKCAFYTKNGCGIQKLQNNLNPHLDKILSHNNIKNANIITCDFIDSNFINKIIQKNKENNN